LRLGFNLIKNSATKCCALAAEPPFPQIKILPFFFKFLEINLIESKIYFSFFNPLFKNFISKPQSL
jgi:hypothetical protein